jgi:hypothetical protein
MPGRLKVSPAIYLEVLELALFITDFYDKINWLWVGLAFTIRKI